MRNPITTWLALLVITLALKGCGEEPQTQTPDQSNDVAEQQTEESLAMVVETSEQTYWRDGDEIKTIDDVRTMVLAQETKIEDGFTFVIDESYEREGQLRVVFTASPASKTDVDLKAAADASFDELKRVFDQRAEAAALREEAYLKQKAKEASAEVSRLQKELTDLQAIRHGLATTDDSRMELRKLNRQIDNALADLIALEKAVVNAERRNDRKGYVKLLRVR